PAPIAVEIAQAETAAVERALATLHERPPARCDACGGARFYEKPRDGYWRCRPCHPGTGAPRPTATEEREATARARSEARAAVLAPREAWLRRRNAVDQQRDRRRLRDVLPGWRDYLLHRARPDRYPRTAAMREWQDDRLLDLAQKHA